MVKISSMQNTEKLNLKSTLYTVSLHSSLFLGLNLSLEELGFKAYDCIFIIKLTCNTLITHYTN